MQKIAHILNPVKVLPNSDLYNAQPITFESMHLAKKFSIGTVEVELYTVCYPEDTEIIPSYFRKTSHLDRSILDVGSFEVSRKLPFITDILQRVYENSTADYLIYTNVDIALMPHFYCTVAEYIKKGYDALVINRRTIQNIYTKVDELPLMYAEIGNSHPGYDCFVFSRKLFPKFSLGNICIGTSKIGVTLLANLITYATKFIELKNSHLTFHIGDDMSWINPKLSDYRIHNGKESLKILTKLHEQKPFSEQGACYQQLQKMKSGNLGDGINRSKKKNILKKLLKTYFK